MVLEECLTPMGLTQRELADAIHLPYQRVNNLLSDAGALPLHGSKAGEILGMSADFWMNLRLRWVLYFAHQNESSILQEIQPFVTNSN